MKNGLITDEYGNKFWYKNDKFYREDGPAVEYIDGSKFWYQNGKYHREDGPAVEFSDGVEYWYYQGEYINVSSQEEFEKFLKLKLFY